MKEGTDRNSVLFINRVYPPDFAATGQLLAELATALATDGWCVTVVCARTTPGAPGEEVTNGVRVARVGGLPFTRESHWMRALSYLSLYPLLLWRVWRQQPRADVIVTMTDPPLQLVLGPVLRWLTGARIVHWAQDIYPELAEELGVVPAGLVTRALRVVSTWGLKRYDRIVVVGRCMRTRLLERGIAAEAVSVIPNWADAELVRPVAPEENPFRTEHGLDDRFVVMYSGNLGLAHPFEQILDGAARLATALPEALIVFVGVGPRLPWVKQQVEERGLGNVRFLPPQPKASLGESLSAADLHLACMHHNLCGLVVPSKVYGVLAAGRPCLFLGPAESEAACLIREHRCGEVLPSADGVTLAECITQWCGDRDRVEIAGRRARAAAEGWGLTQAVRAFETVFQEINCNPSPSGS